ncbi:MAG TPA: murein L,D-transpeptidase catalytic domain family protein, partial [Phnomibacter sp.]|nr:murein L,D-transpeptidase catalytic domain family protein [Phnomibacter sp.]
VIVLLSTIYCTRLQAQPSISGPSKSYPSYKASVRDGPTRPDLKFLSEKLTDAYYYCDENGLDMHSAIFIDLGMHSGYFRCWVIGFKDGVISLQGSVAHGSGKGEWLPAGERKYSNEMGSLLSSLGKYKIGEAYTGRYGLSYRLYGLEPSNSNAFRRAIVLHGYDCIPDHQSAGALCQSWGCPSVSQNFFRKLRQVIEKSEEPMLLWIFDSVKETQKK